MSEGWRRCWVCHAEKDASALDETGRCHGCATAAAATDAGMTYGKYTALRRSGLLGKQLALQDRLNRQRYSRIYCKNCGGTIPEGSEEFCCLECEESWERKESGETAQEREKPKEKKIRTCRFCGKPVTGKRQYCGRRCQYLYNRDHNLELQRGYREKKRGAAGSD